MVDYKGFGRWLKETREHESLTQKQLADLIGAGKAYISKLENATPHTKTGTPPLVPLDTLASLVKHLHTQITEALKAYGLLEETGMLLDTRETQAIKSLRKLPKTQRELIFDLIRTAHRRPPDENTGNGETMTGTDD